MSNQEKSPTGLSPLSDAELQEAGDNLTRCLDAYDQRGEEGLQQEMELLHPNPELAKVGLHGIYSPLKGGGWIHGLMSDQTPPTRKATSSETK